MHGWLATSVTLLAAAVADCDGGVALLRGSATARVTTFGRGCPGGGGREPRLETRGAPGMPKQPNGSLQIGLSDGAPLSLAVCAQAGVLDAAAASSFFPGVSLTAGLRLRIGD